jgi:formate hydrogenlyase subunit 3/multisubunit Na+/H+ antiporter MnhD subunit
MSAPLLWIGIPFLASIGAWFLQDKRRLVFYLSAGLFALLGLTAMVQNIGGVIRFGSATIEIKSTVIFMGRSFILENKDRFFLAFVSFAMLFWILGSRISQAPAKFLPISMMVVSLLTAALAVEPFLYSAILMELVVVVTLPLLMSRDKPITKGILHYLIYQSLAMPFILLAGWILSGSQANPADAKQLQIAALLLAIGFAFWLGVFPFHVWIPELAEESQAYPIGFLLTLLPPVSLMIILKFINGLVWLRDTSYLPVILQIVGAVMIVTGGLWASMQTNLKKMFGYIILIDSGFMLLCISVSAQAGLELFYLSLIPHVLAMAILVYALAYFERHQMEPSLESLRGEMKNHPVLFIAMFTAIFSIIGLPFFASFSLHLALFENLTAQTGVIVWVLIGYFCLLIAAFRLLVVLLENKYSRWRISESNGDLFYLVPGIFFLLMMGIFPRVFIGGVWQTFAALLSLS